ncbi:serine endopeptidase [Colletotrichum karsti]|uniref:Serine endopeptidase n=1 Tax=Colletotrichum karsti TaxID=1095194 RepID=A0A9P6LF24_9PEZI|nr:serine endopeptidase [Colletotrichum karsti]KAF9870736.1 serine endopeptidase [Colletotrichum karsti]
MRVIFVVQLIAFAAAIMGEKFIVEFGSSKVRLTDRAEDREELIGKLTTDERTKIVKRFDHAIFSGVVIETGNHNLDTLRALPNVGNVWTSRNEGMLAHLSDSKPTQ